MLTLRSQFLPHYFGGVPKWRLWLRSFGGKRVLPDFACVGAIKSGTSDVSAYLFQHPCILPPLSKEIPTTNTDRWLPYYPTVREMEEVAKEHGKALTGYFLPMIHNVTLMDNYHAARPDAKIILVLRNPVDRAYSHYKWDLLLGGKRASTSQYYKTFADYVNFSLDLFPAMPVPSSSPIQLLQAGIYVKSVELWIERFGRENIHILRAEDFFENVATSVCGIHDFLGIPALKPELHAIVNQNPIKAPPADEVTRAKLYDFYRPWNEKLYAVIGRDMCWEPREPSN